MDEEEQNVNPALVEDLKGKEIVNMSQDEFRRAMVYLFQKLGMVDQGGRLIFKKAPKGG